VKSLIFVMVNYLMNDEIPKMGLAATEVAKLRDLPQTGNATGIEVHQPAPVSHSRLRGGAWTTSI
jgi:hypothetical protein